VERRLACEAGGSLTWWGEAPERLPVTPGKPADTINVVAGAERRAEPWSIAGPRLGTLIGVTR